MSNLSPKRNVIHMVEQCGFELSYTYENLFFVDSSDFILQMGEDDKKVILFFGNADPEESTDEIYENLLKHSPDTIDLVNAGHFAIEEAEEENKLQIRFYPIEEEG